jgi:hypothetical protein
MIRRVAVILALAAPLISAQVVEALVEGLVRDTKGGSIPGVTVSLQSTAFTSKTDAKGHYQIRISKAGTYSIQAQADGFAAATSGPFSVSLAESKNINLTLQPLEAAYFDAPNFVVAGITDPSNHGGHGSDVLLRSTEVLAKETASLGSSSENPKPVIEAAREAQRAAEQDPSEVHLFDWGSELLVHRATAQAIEVFTKSVRLFPKSTRMLLGLAVAWYTNGSDDNAEHYFFAACDVNPQDPLPYEFMGKVQSDAIIQSEGYAERMARFAQLHPDNAWANYYSAASLWKQRTGPDDSATLDKVQILLEKSLHLDATLGPAYLLLGILYSERRDTAHAIAAYQKANVEEAHYRLSQEYRKLGDTDNADKELAIYNQLSQMSAEAAQRERMAIQQFVFTLRH